MGSEPRTFPSEGGSGELNLFQARFETSLQRAYELGSSIWRAEEISFDRFTQFCLEWAVSRSRKAENQVEVLERLLSHPELSLLCGLLEGIPQALSDARGRLAALLGERHTVCHETFPTIGFPREDFEIALLNAASRRCLLRGFKLEEAISRHMAFPDFYLSAAALSSDPVVAQRAGDLFSRKYFPLAQSYIRKRWSTVPEASDRVSALFFCALYPHTLAEKTGNPSKDETLRPPLLAEYRGQGPLAAWLTLTLGNMVRDSIRTSKTTISIDEEREVDTEGSRLPAMTLTSEPDQRAKIDRSNCIRMLQAGLANVWRTLKPREQLTLVMQTLMEIPPSLIARRVFHVHEGTVTKYTTAALKKIKEGLEAYAVQEARMEKREAESCFEFMREAFPETETLAGGIVRAASGSG